MRQSEVRFHTTANLPRRFLQFLKTATGSEEFWLMVNIVAEAMKSFPASLALTPSESVDSTASGHAENAPVLTLFDNPVMSRSDHPATPHSSSTDGLSPEDRALRSRLLLLLPPRPDLQK